MRVRVCLINDVKAKREGQQPLEDVPTSSLGLSPYIPTILPLGFGLVVLFEMPHRLSHIGNMIPPLKVKSHRQNATQAMSHTGYKNATQATKEGCHTDRIKISYLLQDVRVYDGIAFRLGVFGVALFRLLCKVDLPSSAIMILTF